MTHIEDPNFWKKVVEPPAPPPKPKAKPSVRAKGTEGRSTYGAKC